ncbi:MAG: hypothetical protein K2N44_06315 [Lachnospiraceae bacterium]|nr:hypothetical protein [Lachnospiraceae bacterium]
MTTTNKLIVFLMTSVLLLNGCGKKETASVPDTPQETVECVMESIKDLDMETLNHYTDNYVQTYHNWIGVPVENEYRTFNELLQPRSKHSSRYQSAYKLDQKIMENLTWKITDVREGSDTAEIDMEITNIDMSQVMGVYTTQILENMLESPGIGITQFVKDMSELATAKDTLISIIDGLDDSDISTINVTVSAYQDSGQWKIHLTHDFINAFSGNMYTDDYAADMEQRIDELEEQMERKADQWAESIENRVNKWAEQFE